MTICYCTHKIIQSVHLKLLLCMRNSMKNIHNSANHHFSSNSCNQIAKDQGGASRMIYLSTANIKFYRDFMQLSSLIYHRTLFFEWPNSKGQQPTEPLLFIDSYFQTVATASNIYKLTTTVMKQHFKANLFVMLPKCGSWTQADQKVAIDAPRKHK